MLTLVPNASSAYQSYVCRCNLLGTLGDKTANGGETRMKALRQVLAATIVLTGTGCTSLQYATDLSHLDSPGYTISYPAYEVVISTKEDAAATRGQINCYDDAGCIERLFASTRSSPKLLAQLFMFPPNRSSLSIEHGPFGHGVRAVGWDANSPYTKGSATVEGPRGWHLRSLTDPSAATLRLRIRVPMILSLPVATQAGEHVAGATHDIGNGNPGLSYSTRFSGRANGVISVTDFVKRAKGARESDKSFHWFPAVACRTATITLKAKATNGDQEDVAEVSLLVPDIGYVLPVPLRPGSHIRLDPVCGVDSFD